MRQTLVHHCAVTVTALPGSLRADVLITGDVDLEAAPLLADAVRRLSGFAPRSVFIDLAGVTFAGSALPNFLAQAHNRLPRGSSLVVCGVGPVTHSVLVATGMLDIVTLCDNQLS